MVEIALWWLLPIVLALFAFWTLKRHIIYLSITLAFLHCTGSGLVVYFWHRDNPTRHLGKSVLVGAVVSFEALLVATLIFIIEPGYQGTMHSTEPHKSWLNRIVHAARVDLRSLTAVDLGYRDFNTKTERTFLMHDLQGVHLEGATLDQSLFTGANLSGAYLQSASLNLAHLENSDLSGAHMQEADLSSAHCSNVHLNGADLTHAFLPAAELDKAELVNANLTGAQLAEANLKGAFLSAARLYRAKLTGAVDLTGATLTSADLEEADLRTAVGLKPEQLSTVCTLYNALLDPALNLAVKANYPWLLEKPNHDEEGGCLTPATK